MTKSEIRKVYLEKRQGIGANRSAAKSRRIAELFFDGIRLAGVKNLHCFIPIVRFNEIDTSFIFQRIWRDYLEIRTIVPRVNFATGEIENHAITAVTKLVENKWGIAEPVTSKILKPGEIDMVLVPLLCIDKMGFRVGYGKGFYDRLLSKCRPDCLKVGLSYFPPVNEIEDVGDHDIPLDLCVTPERIFHW
ncbi:MAG: 5-formyltetrahydrofolate cyclo-ligase [Pyrinomonadaceae bacterium]